MTDPTSDSTSAFVPVSEAMQERAVAARLGAEWSRLHTGFLALVTLLAAALRLWHVEAWSVAAGEAGLWQRMVAGDASPWAGIAGPMRFLWDAGLLPGHGEGSLRLPFVFLGTIAPPLLALVGEPFVGRRPALFAAALLAVHPQHIEASQTATGVVAAVTFSLLALGAVHVAVATRRIPHAVAAAVFSWLAIGSHGSGLFAVHIALAVACWRRWPHAEPRDRVRGALWVALALAASAAIANWLWPVDPNGVRGLAGAAAAMWEFLRNVGPVLLLLAVLELLQRPFRPQLLPPALAAVVPVAMAFLLGATVSPVTSTLPMLALPPLLLLAAKSAIALADAVRAGLGGGNRLTVVGPALLGALAAVLEPAIGTYLYATARSGSRPDWRGAAEVVVASTRQNRFAVLAGQGHASLMYYLRPEQGRPGPGDPHPGILIAPFDVRVDVSPFLAYAEVQGSDLFLALLEAEVQRFQQANRDTLSRFRLIGVLPCAGEAGDEAVSVYRLRPPE